MQSSGGTTTAPNRKSLIEVGVLYRHGGLFFKLHVSRVNPLVWKLLFYWYYHLQSCVNKNCCTSISNVLLLIGGFCTTSNIFLHDASVVISYLENLLVSLYVTTLCCTPIAFSLLTSSLHIIHLKYYINNAFREPCSQFKIIKLRQTKLMLSTINYS